MKERDKVRENFLSKIQYPMIRDKLFTTHLRLTLDIIGNLGKNILSWLLRLEISRKFIEKFDFICVSLKYAYSLIL